MDMLTKVKRKFILFLTLLMLVLGWGGAVLFQLFFAEYYSPYYPLIPVFFYVFGFIFIYLFEYMHKHVFSYAKGYDPAWKDPNMDMMA